MPKRDQETYKIEIKNEPTEVRDIRNKILDTFNELEFIEEGHKYFLRGEELRSVSSVVSDYEEPFDSERKAAEYALKHGETKEYWLDQWRWNNLKATTTGTLVHSYAESLSWIKAGHPEMITPENVCKYISEKNWLIPTRTKEEAALKFWKDMPDSLHIVLPETKVYSGVNPTLSPFKFNYAGTFDLLLYYKHPTNDALSGLLLCDYKTNAELMKEYARKFGKFLKPPFNDIYDEPMGGYTIQQSLYQIPMEDIGLKVLGRRLIWLKDDATYEVIKLPDVTEKLRKDLKK